MFSMSPAGKRKGIGKIGFRLTAPLVVRAADFVFKTHKTPPGLMGKWRIWNLYDCVRDLRLGAPIYPDQPGKRVLPACTAMLVFAIAETGAATPSIVRGRSRIAAKPF